MAARHRQRAKQRRTLPVICQECAKPAGLVTGLLIYPHRPDLRDKPFWRCLCGAYCGCHPGTQQPLGSPCGPETRKARSAAHEAFDPLWKRKMEREGISKGAARAAAYAWLSEQLGIEAKDCHVGMMDRATAVRVAEVCAPFSQARAA